MSHKIDLTGQTLFNITVISEAPNKQGRIAWHCLCSCGNNFITTTHALRSKRSLQQTCGVCKTKIIGNSNKRLYTIWIGMHRRCNDTKWHKYYNYGGRGITVDTIWNSYLIFESWALANGYTQDLTLDRIHPNDPYSPSTCRWATPTIQSRNRRKKQNTSSKFVGVYWNGKRSKWVAEVTVKNQKIYLGRHETELKAKQARQQYIQQNNLKGFRYV